MPDAAIGADVMVGFPGETEAEFEDNRAFIDSLPFTYLHVFTYSERPGTPAAASPDQVPIPLRKDRNRILRELAAVRFGAGEREEKVSLTDAPRIVLQPLNFGARHRRRERARQADIRNQITKYHFLRNSVSRIGVRPPLNRDSAGSLPTLIC
jgi:hypothetical protein